MESEEQFDTNNYPETLRLDFQRFQEAQAEFHFGILAGSALIHLQQKPQIREAFGHDLGTLASFFRDFTPNNMDPHTLTGLANHLNKMDPPLSEELREIVFTVIAKSTDQSNPVRALFGGPTGRIAKTWHHFFSVKTEDIQQQAQLQEPNTTIPKVALFLLNRIAQKVQSIKRATQLNLRVHATIYNKIISKAAAALHHEDYLHSQVLVLSQAAAALENSPSKT
eukprot:3932674-Rhodomonas_salina.1